jgi:glutathione reductase (NADPH)
MREEQFSRAGIATFNGHAKFAAPTTIKITEKGGTDDHHLINGKHVIIATGAKPAKLNIPGEEYVTTSAH